MIFVTSYPYVGPRHIRVFDFFKKKDDLTFILPEVWKMKGGKVVLKPLPKPGLNIIPTPAHFFHSRYFLIGGLLKGWMPATGRILRKFGNPGDVVYTAIEPNLLTTYLNARLAKSLGMKHVFFTWQNVPYEERLSGIKLALTRWLIRKNISLSQGAVCGNSRALEILKPYVPKDFKLIEAPVSGVDTEYFRPDIASDFRERYSLQDKIVVTFVGAMDERKGIMPMLEAFAASLKKQPMLHFVMIGAGPSDDRIADFITHHNLKQHVTRLPWLPNEELPEILSASDMFIYPSTPFGGWEEQFGYSAAEASACGLPVISSPTGAIVEKVIDGVTGLLVDPSSSQELEAGILKLAADRELRKTMGIAGRKLIIEKFSHEIVASRMEELLRNL